MALTEAQKEFIAASIDHLLDFSSSVNELTVQIKKLREALLHEIESHHDFYMLRKCVFHPTETLLGLEKYNDKVSLATIGEVQKYIFDLCFQQIEKVAPKNSFLLETIFTEFEQLKQQIISEDNCRTYFTTVVPPAENQQLPWENIQDEGRMFEFSIHITEGNIFIKTLIKLPDNTEKKHCEFFKALNDNPSYEYICSLIPEAKHRARRICKFLICKYFLKLDLVDPEDHILLIESPVLDKILTHYDYLLLLLTRKIGTHHLLALNESQVNQLMNETVINLIKNNICSMKKALQLTAWEIATMTTYFPLILNQKIGFEDLCHLSLDQSKILITPPIINLIKNDKISLELVKLLPIASKDLFNNHFYAEYFLKNTIDWQKVFMFDSFYIYNFLLDKAVINLIANRILDFNDIHRINLPTLFALKNSTISALLCQQKMTLKELGELSLNKIALIESSAEICEWLEKNLVTIDKVDPKNLSLMLCEVYTHRLIALANHQPLQLQGELDNLKKIKEEIRRFIKKEHIPDYELKEKLIIVFFQKLKAMLDNLAIDKNKIRKDVCQKITNIIDLSCTAHIKLFRLTQEIKNFQNLHPIQSQIIIAQYKSFVPHSLFKQQDKNANHFINILNNINYFGEFISPKSIMIKSASVKKMRTY